MMRRQAGWRALTASLVFLLATGPACLAQEVSQLRGEVFLAGRTRVDPPPDEPKNSHAYMTVSGAAALRMYRAMRSAEEANPCEAGQRMKRAGALVCSATRDGRTATCDFSVDVIRGELAEVGPAEMRKKARDFSRAFSVTAKE